MKTSNKLRIPTRHRHPYGERIQALVASFPTLFNHGLADEPFDANGHAAITFDKWACGPAPGSGALCAAQFILSIWNTTTEWDCGRFDLHRALGVWDDRHREAFLAWANDPWWP